MTGRATLRSSSSGSNGRPSAAWTPSSLEEVPGDEGGTRETALDGSRVALHREGIREDAGLAAHRLVIVRA